MAYAHHVVGFGLKKAGFRWELRRQGDQKIGLWRKSLRAPATANAAMTGVAARPARLVLIPGFGDTPVSWLSVITLLLPLLSRKFDEIVLVDFPGYSGFLAREKPFASVDLLIQSLGDALDSLEPRVIVGHSLGGWLTARYALDYGVGRRPLPQFANKHGYAGPEEIVLIAPSGSYADEESLTEWEGLFKRFATEGYAVLRPLVFKREPRWFRLIQGELQRFGEQPEIREFIASVRREHLITDDLAQMRARVTLLWGDDDKLVWTSSLQSWLKGLPTGPGSPRAYLLKSTGHSPQVERPLITSYLLGKVLLGSGEAVTDSPWWHEAGAAS